MKVKDFASCQAWHGRRKRSAFGLDLRSASVWLRAHEKKSRQTFLLFTPVAFVTASLA